MSFITAWLLPGVFLYSATFFCIKLAVYGVGLELQLYLKYAGYSDIERPNVATLFDVGAIVGSMFLGLASDKLFVKRSPVAFTAALIATVLAYILTFYQDMPHGLFFFMMFLFGGFISGLNNLVSASCAADIGKSQAL